MSLSPSPPPPVVDPPRASRRQRIAIVVVLCVLTPVVTLSVLAGLALQLGDWRSFYAPSSAMLPTLEVGDYFLVDRSAYVDGQMPRRGDIIAFRAPREAGQDANYVKRVVGLPGDRIVLRSGLLVINGVEAVQARIGDYEKGTRLSERLPDGGAGYEILRSGTDSPYENGRYEVPSGSYFVLGDNRDNSVDSRMWLGGPNRAEAWYVPLGNIIGRASYIYWSGPGRLDRIGWALR